MDVDRVNAKREDSLCWKCYFFLFYDRYPTEIEKEHHYGTIHENSCKDCISDVEPILQNPQKYISININYVKIPKGNLLAWIRKEMKQKHNVMDIEMVKIKKDKKKFLCVFDPCDFNVQFISECGYIDELDEINSFVMKNGSCYYMIQTDFLNYSTHLEYFKPKQFGKRYNST
jgi:hypothetical protein